MKVLGINGSPRIGGNTDVLLDRFLEGARSAGAKTEKVILNNLKFSPCQECAQVRDDGKCIIEDDMQPIYKKIKDADIIILASPIFFGSLSAQTKMMIDRFQCIWRTRYVLKKDVYQKRRKGIFVCVEGSNRQDFFDNAKSIVRNFFATNNVDYNQELFCAGVDKSGDVSKRTDVLRQAFELGKKIVID